MGVLQLDISMQPIDLVSIEEAVSKVVTGQAQLISSDESVLYRGPHSDEVGHYKNIPSALIRDGRIVVPKPLIIQVLSYVKLRPFATQHVVRRVVYARDNWTCQYCGKGVDRKTATLDHIKPRSRGGENSYSNLTTACGPCNRKKADKLPMEAHMFPKTTPKAPSYVQTSWAGKLEPIQAEYVADYYRVAVEVLAPKSS
jgi:hypothetical protein